MLMSCSRQLFFFSFSFSSSFSSLFFLLFLLFPPAFSANHETSLLFSWLHSVSPTPSAFSNWNILDPNPCNWTSITCSSENLVTEINIQSIPLQLLLPFNLSSFQSLQKLVISDSNVTGTISDDIGNSSELIVIDLSSNNLLGEIPASIGKLQKLDSLTLNSNHLTGKLPLELTNCSNLKNLVIFDNQLSGIIPVELGNLKNLQVLRAGGNNDITGTIPDELGNCINLTVLGLAETRISGSLPASLGRLGKLQILSIYTTMISGEIPAEIGNCSELVNLFLYENSFSGSLPPSLGKLQKLEALFLWQNNLVGLIPEEIGNCKSLRKFDLSLNSLSGTIPYSLGILSELEEFMISDNNVSGTIPSNLSNATNLIQLQLDKNQISGLIPPQLGLLSKLTVFYAWQNKLEGSIPSTLADLKNLQALDLSQNSLTGVLPPGLFQLRNLTKLLLISNDISGSIPDEIGNLTSLLRLRLGNNRITGGIPKSIGNLKNLNFLDLSGNRLSGLVPDEIGSCSELQMIDLHNNVLEGPLPNSLSSLSELQVLDVTDNRFSGPIPASFGRLASLNKLILRANSFSGSIPSSIRLCSSLQLLDLSNNELAGNIPEEIGLIQTLEIALNLSFNQLTGPIPPQISSLTKLSVLDLSHNRLQGDLKPLAELDNLVSLNISFNNFSGYLPDNKLFRQLSPVDISGNEGLCSSITDSCFLSDSGLRDGTDRTISRKLKLVIALLVILTGVMVVMGIIAVIRARIAITDDDDDSELGDTWPWQFTPFQKLSFSIDEILKSLIDVNIIGKGCSGIVYRADMKNGDVIAVKKLWSTTMESKKEEKCTVRDSFSTEVKTLGSIRHKNIVKFLGCCWNRKTRLLMYDYMPNGSLGSLLHERTGNALEWEFRYQILLGAAQGLAYLHHDCVPPIVHRDIKANNILIGLQLEPYIADFGLAKLVENGDFARSSNTVAGSYGYIAPEYGYTTKITEKSDVYSFGVVMFEVLTGKQPIDPTIPDGLHIVDWVRSRKTRIEVVDPTLLSRPDSEIDEMVQAIGIAILCVNSNPEERPTMKDVAAMLKEVKLEREDYAKVDLLIKASPTNNNGEEKNKRNGIIAPSSSKLAVQSLSFSGSSLLYSSSSHGNKGFK